MCGEKLFKIFWDFFLDDQPTINKVFVSTQNNWEIRFQKLSLDGSNVHSKIDLPLFQELICERLAFLKRKSIKIQKAN